jgi:hypothetical protein
LYCCSVSRQRNGISGKKFGKRLRSVLCSTRSSYPSCRTRCEDASQHTKFSHYIRLVISLPFINCQ